MAQRLRVIHAGANSPSRQMRVCFTVDIYTMIFVFTDGETPLVQKSKRRQAPGSLHNRPTPHSTPFPVRVCPDDSLDLRVGSTVPISAFALCKRRDTL